MTETFMLFVEETARDAEKRGEERGRTQTRERFAIRLIINGLSDKETSEITLFPLKQIKELREMIAGGYDEDSIMWSRYPQLSRLAGEV